MPRSNDWLEKQLAISLEQYRRLDAENKRLRKTVKVLARFIGKPTLKNLIKYWRTSREN